MAIVSLVVGNLRSRWNDGDDDVIFELKLGRPGELQDANDSLTTTPGVAVVLVDILGEEGNN
ncbi:unnamed protein product [Schistosoma curassoni]|uniref:PDZ domain-containing protein n=1 Tax=Schistosoma curassoni TaxID=6186 RepID=A0A183K9W1_9TREM|nr:unnamed protein product [Schistosoma curassoni]